MLYEGDAPLRGRWLTLDDAIARGMLVVREKGSHGVVAAVTVENRSRTENIFLMGGEILAGGKQTRTVRSDVVLTLGERAELPVYCVEAHRWKGGETFSAGRLLAPQSIQLELRRGAAQAEIWAEVARSNEALRAENDTGSLEAAVKTKAVQDKLEDVRGAIVRHIPAEAVGYIFVHQGRALEMELFGNPSLARELFPKLLDSYAVDCVIVGLERPEPHEEDGHSTAIEFFERACRAGGDRAKSPGSGDGIRTRAERLIGGGVSLESNLVHFGVQSERRIVPLSKPLPRRPIVPLPQEERQE